MPYEYSIGAIERQLQHRRNQVFDGRASVSRLLAEVAETELTIAHALADIADAEKAIAALKAIEA